MSLFNSYIKFGRTLRNIRLRSLELQRDIFAVYKEVRYKHYVPIITTIASILPETLISPASIRWIRCR